jgi:hypothetical protein
LEQTHRFPCQGNCAGPQVQTRVFSSFCTAALCLFVVLSAAICVPDCLIAGTSVQQGTLNWQAYNGITLQAVFDDSLQKSIVKATGNQNGIWSYASANLTNAQLNPSSKYRLEGWMKVEQLSDKRFPPYFKLGANDGNGKWLTNYDATKYDVVAMNTWQKLWCEFELSPYGASGYVAIEKGTLAPVSATIYLRDVTLTEIANFSPPERASFNPEPPKLAALAKQRPRLYLDSQAIQRIKSSISKYPYSKFWTYVKKQADSFASQTPPTEITDWSGDIRGIGDRLPFIAIAYLLTGDPKYLDAERKWMNAICLYPSWGLVANGGDTDLDAAHLLTGMAIAYDWLHDTFTPRDRERYSLKMLHHADILYLCLQNKSIFWATDYLQNHNYVNVLSVAVAGLALYGESPKAESYVVMAHDNFHKVIQLLSPDGASHEGMGYWEYGTGALLRYHEAMSPVFGMDDVLDSSFFKNTAKFRLYVSIPGYVENVDFGDSARYEWSGPGYILRSLAGVFRDGTAQWLSERIEAARGPGVRMSWLDLVWYDPSVKPTPPDGLPTNAYFDNLGILITRSSWADDASWVFFKAGPPQGYLALSKGQFAGSHIHPDEGSFLIWAYGKWLVIDDGYVYKKRTSNHNICTFNGIGQLGEGGMWFDPSPLRALRSSPVAIAYSNIQPAYQYIAADLTNIYGPNAFLSHFERTIIVFLSGYVVVRDKTDFSKPSDFVGLVHLGKGNVQKTGGSGFIYSDGGIKLGMDVFSNNAVTTGAHAFSIPAGEQHSGFGNYTGNVVQVEHAGSNGDTVISVFRPVRAGGALSAPKTATTSGGDSFRFDDANISFNIDFARHEVSFHKLTLR